MDSLNDGSGLMWSRLFCGRGRGGVGLALEVWGGPVASRMWLRWQQVGLVLYLFAFDIVPFLTDGRVCWVRDRCSLVGLLVFSGFLSVVRE